MRPDPLTPEPCVVRVERIERHDQGLRTPGQRAMVAVQAASDRDGHELTWVIPAADAPIVGAQLRVTIEHLPSDDPQAVVKARLDAEARGEPSRRHSDLGHPAS